MIIVNDQPRLMTMIPSEDANIIVKGLQAWNHPGSNKTPSSGFASIRNTDRLCGETFDKIWGKCPFPEYRLEITN